MNTLSLSHHLLRLLILIWPLTFSVQAPAQSRAGAVFSNRASAPAKKILLIAGHPSHGPGEHEFRAGCLLLKKCLDQVPGITSIVYSNGWPDVPNAFDGVDAVLNYADGGAGHPVLQDKHREVIGDLVKRGVGLGCAHYGVEIP